jgi:hypothetical protein
LYREKFIFLSIAGVLELMSLFRSINDDLQTDDFYCHNVSAAQLKNLLSQLTKRQSAPFLISDLNKQQSDVLTCMNAITIQFGIIKGRIALADLLLKSEQIRR